MLLLADSESESELESGAGSDSGPDSETAGEAVVRRDRMLSDHLEHSVQIDQRMHQIEMVRLIAAEVQVAILELDEEWVQVLLRLGREVAVAVTKLVGPQESRLAFEFEFLALPGPHRRPDHQVIRQDPCYQIEQQLDQSQGFPA